MKGVKAPDYIRKFIYKKIEDQFHIKFYSEIMGESPIGARLGGKDGLPFYERTTEDEHDAISLCQNIFITMCLKEEEFSPVSLAPLDLTMANVSSFSKICVWTCTIRSIFGSYAKY